MTIYSDVIAPETLINHLNDPSWAVVDCRFDLKNPTWGHESYLHAHIPGAVFADLDQDLAGRVIAGQTGRHPLPDLHQFTENLSYWGIDSSTQVVVYDTTGGSFAARLWWMLRFMGHEAVAVLDGGFPLWQKEGYPVAQGEEQRQAKLFHANLQGDMMVDAAQVDIIRQEPHYRLIDARAPERYRGEVEPIDPVAGHIPGAVNRFHGENLGPDGRFLPAEILREQYMQILDGIPPENSVMYCGSGVTSCHHLVAMQRAGLPGAKLYVGSWSDWITDRKRPIK